MKEYKKYCWDCKKELDVSLFYKDKTRADGLRYQCKSCVKKYQQTKLEHIAKLAKQRYHKNKEFMQEYSKKYYRANIDKCRAIALKWKYNNKDKVKASELKSRLKNPDKAAWDISQRRLVVKRATPIWANKKLIVKIYKLRIRLNKIAGHEKYHVDHIIPLRGKKVSGLHVPENLKLSLASENLLKGNRLCP